ncbi:MAG TPA: UDP-N-acetylmuramoyl-tripeptide--D-alanyl-D-alanine ligase [Polyangiaceae bacterium]|jgi:UDP-N-acetylmuramoyl-tripeptide--D-alanyl-D-alanine ligase|nr:UDP-N-acetylmuramoyl-tripeptide--D-alanyl-D-alanine ligase [Polyangiaceae bacterium]
MATAIPPNRASFTVDEIARATGGRVVCSGEPSVGVCTDSRAIRDGAAFVALTGDKFDGHAFLASAVALGARTLVVSKDDVGPWAGGAQPAVVRVDDTRRALGALSHAHRARWGGAAPPRIVVAITGSAGKTTTKSVLARVLDAMAPGTVHATVGNLNNDIGVPMTLLGLDEAHHYAVVEVGTNARGEIASLAGITMPDAGVLTLVAAAHTAGLGSIEEVAVEKGALLAALPSGGLAVANADDARAVAQLARSSANTTFTFGFAEKSDYRVAIVESRGARGSRLSIVRRSGTLEVDSPLLGEAGALAIAASLAVAEWAIGRAASVEEVQAALSPLAEEDDGRLSLLPLADGTLVIDDSYNANPASMGASLRAACDVAKRENRRLVVVLGEMRELGAMSTAEHEKLGQIVARAIVAEVISVGGEAERVTREAARAGKTAWFALDAEQAIGTVLSRVLPGDVVLVKGSRGVATEKIVRALVEARGRVPRGGGAA